MNLSHSSARSLLVLWLACTSAGIARAQATQQGGQFEPMVGQPGKVVWVPTPQMIVDKMLDMARVAPQDFVVDLGSGDGRNIITAAKRGATVLALFLLPDNPTKLRDKFPALKPGTRIVANTFWLKGRDPDESAAQISAWTATRGAPQAQAPVEQGTFQPEVGQPGKDVVWVPTPAVTVDKMLDLANVTPQDYVVDLGSGDGRNVIAAAKRGATALGVEYNPDMVTLSQRAAAKEGVSDKATFVEGDMFAADFSKATVLALFLLPDNMRTLRPKFLALKPGTRIVANTFGIDGWEPDVRDTASGDCGGWCTVLLWIVPARVGGTWQLPEGTLTIQQDFQKLSGTFRTGADDLETIKNGRMNGEQITFTGGAAEYTGRVNGNRLEGTFKSGNQTGTWTATRAN